LLHCCNVVLLPRHIAPLFYFIIAPPPISTLFPYTTLFRSQSYSARRIPPPADPKPARSCGTARTIRPRHQLIRAAMKKRRSRPRSEEHTSELQSRENLVCRLLLEKKKKKHIATHPDIHDYT